MHPTRSTVPRTYRTLGYVEVLSDDGTRLRAWTNDPAGSIDGPTVLLCNGLGTNPWAWPAFLDPDCGVRVVSWNHRGTGGSDRPTDPERVGIGEFVEDALSVLDHFALDKVVVAGWSMGVNTMFELALRHPERVAGLFAVCGVPGNTFATMLGPLHIPHWAARASIVTLARTLRRTGRFLTPVTTRLPVGNRTIAVAGRTGFMLRQADPLVSAQAVREFLTTPVDWYSHLALKTSEHARVSLRGIRVPALFVAGRYDVLAGARDMASAAARMSDARYVELAASHFAPMEQPDVIHDLLLEFLARCGSRAPD